MSKIKLLSISALFGIFLVANKLISSSNGSLFCAWKHIENINWPAGCIGFVTKNRDDRHVELINFTEKLFVFVFNNQNYILLGLKIYAYFAS